MYEELKDNPEISPLRVDVVVADAVKARDAFAAQSDDIPRWPFDGELAAKRAAIDSLSREFDEKFQILLEYYTCLKDTKDEAKVEVTSLKKRIKYKEEKVADIFLEGGCTQACATALGAMEVGRLKDLDSGAIISSTHDIEYCALVKDRGEVISTFSAPVFFYCNHNDPLCKKLSEFIDKISPDVAIFTAEIHKSMVKQDCTHAIHDIKVKAGVELALPHTLNHLGNTKQWSFLRVQGNNLCQLTRASFPLPGCACFIYMFTGYGYVVFLPALEIMDEENGFDNISANIETHEDPETLFKSCVKIGMRKGQAVFCPYGFLPLVVTVNLQAEKGASTYMPDHSSFGITYVGCEAPAEFPVAITTEIHAQGCKSAKSQMKSIIPFKKEMLSYFKSIKPVESE